MNKLLSTIAAGLLVLGSSAHAATIASFGTGSTGSVVNGTVTSSEALSDTNNSLYFQGVTTPASDWVWATTSDEFLSLTYTFEFDLTGYDLTTVSLDGFWGIDNIGTVVLNDDHELSNLPNVVIGNFNVLTGFGSDNSNEFNQGMNSLVFSVSNQGGPGAFRAAGAITGELADTAPVPLPAAGWMLIAGLGGLAAMRHRSKAA